MTSSVTDAGPNLVHGVTPSEVVLMKAQWLPTLFAKTPTRASLLELQPSWPLQKISVRVHRNLSCEFVTSVAAPYLAFAGFEVNWIYSGYDDSLAFAESSDADVELVWLDYSRFQLSSSELIDWLMARLADLRSRTRSPILINTDIQKTEFNTRLLEAADSGRRRPARPPRRDRRQRLAAAAVAGRRARPDLVRHRRLLGLVPQRLLAVVRADVGAARRRRRRRARGDRHRQEGEPWIGPSC